MDFIFKEESAQYIVDEKGKPTAVVIPMEDFKRIMSLLYKKMDVQEAKILSGSRNFKKLVQKGLKEVKEGKVKELKEIWDEL